MTIIVVKKITLKMCAFLCILSFSSAYGQFAPFATFELGEGTIESYTTTATQTTPFETIMFDGEFETPPIVFTLTPENGGTPDPCIIRINNVCLLYTSPSPRDLSTSRMPSSA